MATRAGRVPYLEIAADVREQIKTGSLPIGAKLPALRAMAATYAVAPGTVAAALDVLRSEGLIDTVQGKGSEVIANPAEGGTGPESESPAVRELDTRLSAEIASLREDVEHLQAQMMAAYSARGQSYSHDEERADIQTRDVGLWPAA
ncbi:MAG TPA: GntR family transcriptional regulator [Streptosporangiaceae bacterium]|jgi:DNA-binding GntR family transcriptional regulator|nr:GntR family transcriptional regulator [Streptosporangiaceae bacterium]